MIAGQEATTAAAAAASASLLGLISVVLTHTDTVARLGPPLDPIGHLRYQDLSSTDCDSSKRLQ